MLGDDGGMAAGPGVVVVVVVVAVGGGERGVLVVVVVCAQNGVPRPSAWLQLVTVMSRRVTRLRPALPFVILLVSAIRRTAGAG